MIGMLDLIIEFTNHSPQNEIESLIYVIFACASYIVILISVPYIITVIGQIFSKR